MIRITPFFLRQRSYHFWQNWSYISFPCPFQGSILCVSMPLWSLIPEMDNLRKAYNIHPHKKGIMVTPLFMNFIVIEIHVLPRQNLSLAILLPSRQRWTSVERRIPSDRHEALHYQNPCCIFETSWPPCFSHGTTLFPLSPLSPRSTETKCRTGVNSSSQKKGLTEPVSLMEWILISLLISLISLKYHYESH